MLRFIKVFITIYALCIIGIGIVVGGNPEAISNVAIPIAKMTVITAGLWCWLKPAKRKEV